jgi:hypothetical protein
MCSPINAVEINGRVILTHPRFKIDARTSSYHQLAALKGGALI